MAKKYILIVSVLITVLFVGFTAEAYLAPSVYLTELNLNNQDFKTTDKISGTFTVWNSEDYAVAGITYNFLLWNENETDVLTVGEKESNKVIALSANEKKTISFSYDIPENLKSNDYFLRVSLYLQSGIPLGWKDNSINIQGNERFIYLDEPKIIKDGEENHPGIGVGFAEDEISIIRFKAFNPSEETLTAIPHITIYDRTTQGVKVTEFNQEEIKLDPQESKIIDYEMPKLEKPESYLAELRFLESSLSVSNTLYFRWVIEGESADILDIITEDGSLEKGETAEVIIDYAGAADTLTELGEGEIKVEIYNKQGELVGQKQESVNLDEAKKLSMEIPITKDVQNPIIKAQIIKDQNILDEYEVSVDLIEEEVPAAVEVKPPSKSKFIFYLMGFLLILLIVIIVYIFYLKKRKKSLSIFLVLILAGVLFINIHSIQAADEVYWQAPLSASADDIGVTWNEPIKDTVYDIGDPITFSGKVFIPGCINSFTEDKVQFYITKNNLLTSIGEYTFPDSDLEWACPFSECIWTWMWGKICEPWPWALVCLDKINEITSYILEDGVKLGEISTEIFFISHLSSYAEYDQTFTIPEGLEGESEYYAVIHFGGYWMVGLSFPEFYNTIVQEKIYINAPSSVSVPTNLSVETGNCCEASSPPIILNWEVENQSYYQVQVIKSGGDFSSPEIDSGKVDSSSNSYVPILQFGTSYQWRVKIWDNEDNESEWSSTNSFAADSIWPWPEFTCNGQDCNNLVLLIGKEVVLDMVETGTGLCPSGNCTYNWDFAGGTNSGDNTTPIVSFDSEGEKKIRLSITDNDTGNTCTKEKDLETKQLFPPKWWEIPPFGILNSLLSEISGFF